MTSGPCSRRSRLFMALVFAIVAAALGQGVETKPMEANAAAVATEGTGDRSVLAAHIRSMPGRAAEGNEKVMLRSGPAVAVVKDVGTSPVESAAARISDAEGRQRYHESDIPPAARSLSGGGGGDAALWTLLNTPIESWTSEEFLAALAILIIAVTMLCLCFCCCLIPICCSRGGSSSGYGGGGGSSCKDMLLALCCFELCCRGGEDLDCCGDYQGEFA